MIGVFRHIYLTPAAVQARDSISPHSGRWRLYFAGHHVAGIDTQESAVRSPITVAQQLTPNSSRLLNLTATANVIAERNPIW
jgi:hypothetical protein